MSGLSPRRTRALAVGFLLALLFGLCVWYGTMGVDVGLGAYPTEQVVGPTPGQYVGESVAVAGTVVGVDPVELRIDYRGDQERTLLVSGIETPVEPGDELWVFGTLVDEETVAATTTVVIPPVGYRYTYLVSFLSGLWVLGRLSTQWRFEDGALVRRTASLSLGDLWARLGTGGTSDDA